MNSSFSPPSSGEDEMAPFLSTAVANRLLGCLASDNLVLVGGQAVMFWAHHYGLADQQASLTRDIDYFGQRADIEDADIRLANFAHSTHYVSWDDSSPNTGLILVDVPGLDEKVRIDFLWAIQGLGGSDLRERAVRVRLPGADADILVMHPIMCLESKISNLGAFVHKRTAAGIEQARLSVQVIARLILDMLGDGRERDALKTVERLARIAASDSSHFAFSICGIDVLDAIKVDAFSSVEFKSIRMPQIRAHIDDRRARFAALLPPESSIENTRGLRFRA